MRLESLTLRSIRARAVLLKLKRLVTLNGGHFDAAVIERYLKQRDSRPDAPRLSVKSKPNRPLAISHPSSADSAGLALACGTTEAEVASILLNSLINAACDGTPGHPPSEQDVNGVLSMVASAGSQAVSAITAQRTIPAAASIAAPAGPRRSSKGRPAKRNTITLACLALPARHRSTFPWSRCARPPNPRKCRSFPVLCSKLT
jgi:hypothetical protein